MDTRLFFGKDSPVGRAKQEFLQANRVISPKFPGAEPVWRVSWEAFRYYTLTMRDAIIAQLRQCQDGTAQVAKEFAKLQTESPLERFQKLMLSWFLPQIANFIPEWNEIYKPEFGFDLDVFLIGNDPAQVTFWCELFPRLEGKKQEDAFSSEIAFANVPLTKGLSTPSRFGDIPEAVMTLIVAEPTSRGQTFMDTIRRWDDFHGCWSVEKEANIALLLNWAMMSMTDTGSDRIVTPQFSRGGVLHDQISQGELHFR